MHVLHFTTQYYGERMPLQGQSQLFGLVRPFECSDYVQCAVPREIVVSGSGNETNATCVKPFQGGKEMGVG